MAKVTDNPTAPAPAGGNAHGDGQPKTQVVNPNADPKDPNPSAPPAPFGQGTAATPPARKNQGREGAYYIVNPSGAVHSVTREHARGRLSTAGWRMATEAEITQYNSQKIQRADAPIAQPWTPDPDDQLSAALEV